MFYMQINLANQYALYPIMLILVPLVLAYFCLTPLAGFTACLRLVPIKISQA